MYDPYQQLAQEQAHLYVVLHAETIKLNRKHGELDFYMTLMISGLLQGVFIPILNSRRSLLSLLSK